MLFLNMMLKFAPKTKSTWPRRCNQQRNLCNVKAQHVKDFYKIAFYIPFFDTFISQLKSRYSEHKSIFKNFCHWWGNLGFFFVTYKSVLSELALFTKTFHLIPNNIYKYWYFNGPHTNFAKREVLDPAPRI